MNADKKKILQYRSHLFLRVRRRLHLTYKCNRYQNYSKKNIIYWTCAPIQLDITGRSGIITIQSKAREFETHKSRCCFF